MTVDKSTSDEVLLWQGRPAPRCYTFRHWKQALAGSALFLLSSFWLMLGWQLTKEGYSAWLLLIPAPLILGSFIFGPWQIVRARLQWPSIFYHMTDERLHCLPKGAISLPDIVTVQTRRHGQHLASIRLTDKSGKHLVICCIEYPDRLLALLQRHCPELEV